MAATTATSVPTTGAVQIFAAPGVTQPGTGAVAVSNLDAANPIFLGGPNVTATTGVKVASNTTLVLPSVSNAPIYAIATTASVSVVVGVF